LVFIRVDKEKKRIKKPRKLRYSVKKTDKKKPGIFSDSRFSGN